jgi:hypothetical protein
MSEGQDASVSFVPCSLLMMLEERDGYGKPAFGCAIVLLARHGWVELSARSTLRGTACRHGRREAAVVLAAQAQKRIASTGTRSSVSRLRL